MREAVVLAGGFGTRLRPIVQNLPKPMAPVAGRPFLEILLAALASKGIAHVVLSLGYMAEKVTEHFGTHFAGMTLDYEIETTPLGTGGALRQALKRCTDDHVFVFNGDTYLDLELARVEAQWSRCHAPIIIAREVDNTNLYGRLRVERGRVIGFSEKGVTGRGLINAGCYLFPVDILDCVPLTIPFSLEADFMTRAVNERHFEAFMYSGCFIDIGVPEGYLRARNELAAG